MRDKSTLFVKYDIDCRLSENKTYFVCRMVKKNLYITNKDSFLKTNYI